MKATNFISAIIFLAIASVGIDAAAQTVIQGGTVHTVSGDVIENGTVVIGADGTITAVGTDVEIPDQATVVDATGKVVTPGLIESNSSLGLVEIGAVDGSNDTAPEDLDQDYVLAAVRAVDAFNASSAVIPVQRSGGVTSVVSSPSRGVITGQSLWADLGGNTTFATVVEPFAGLHASATRWTVRRTGNSRATLWLTFRELIDDATFFAANQAAFDQNNARKLHASRLDLAAFGEVLSGNKPLSLEAHRAADIRTAVAIAKENGVRLVLVGGAEAWMVKELLAAEKIPVVVEPLGNLPASFEELGARADNAAILQAAGVPLIIASHTARTTPGTFDRWQVTQCAPG